MNGFLLDTNCLSLFFNGRATDIFHKWVEERQLENRLFISVISLQEVEKGAAKFALTKLGNPTKAARISEWLRAFFVTFGERLLPVNADIALIAGHIEGTALARGHTPGVADVLIAATAEAHDLTVVTLDLRDFEALSARCQPPTLI